MDHRQTNPHALQWLPPTPTRHEDAEHPAPLPVPDLTVAPRTADRFDYIVTTICCHGRLRDRTPVKLLGWQPGQPISLVVKARTIVVHAMPTGDHAVEQHGYIRLPAAIRHQCGIQPGDRVVAAVSAGHHQLLVHPFSVVDQALSQLHEEARNIVR